MRIPSLLILTLGLPVSTALAGSFTSGNIVVLRTGSASTGSQGFLDEYTPAGAFVQTITLPFNSATSPAGGDGTSIAFGQSTALIHETSLSDDGAFIVIPGYAVCAASGNVETTTAANNNREIATVDYNGNYVLKNQDSHWASATSGTRGCAGNGFDDFWGDWTGGDSYLGNHGSYANLTGTGTRASAVINGTFYFSVTLGVQYFTVGPQPKSGSSLGTAYYLQSAASGTAYSSAGFAIPKLPFTTYSPGTAGSVAYIANYNSSTPFITPFTWNGSGWTKQSDITLSGISGSAKPLWLAVDYSGAQPVLYFTTTVSQNGVYKFTDTSVTGTMLWGTTAPVTSLFTPAPTAPNYYRGISMAPTQPACPVFTQQPHDTGGSTGDLVPINNDVIVTATGANPYGWHWYKNGSQLSDSVGHIGGSTTTTLWITNKQTADEGTYWIVAANNCGTPVESAHVLLTNVPSCIDPPPAAAVSCAGTTTNFTGGVGNCGALVATNWYFNDSTTPLEDGPGPSGLSTLSGAHTTTLTIANVQVADIGTYRMEVIDASSPPHHSTAAAPLVVHLLTITQPPANVNVVVGHNGSIALTASGAAGYTYSWSKAGVGALVDGPTGNPGSTYSGAAAAALTINNAQLADSGTYSCAVGSDCGSLISNDAVVAVGNPPVITTPLADQALAAGSPCTFALGASGDPILTYTWKHNGTTVASGTDSSFTIGSVAETDKGGYSVTVANNFGSANSSARLLYVIPPETCGLQPPPNQILYDPFNYAVQPHVNGAIWDAFNEIGTTNFQTGVGLTWYNVGNNDFSTLSGPLVDYNGLNYDTTPPLTDGARPLETDEYPVKGLAGNSANIVYFQSDVNGGQVNLHFGPGGAVTSGRIYASFVYQSSGFNTAGDLSGDILCGFGTGGTNSLTHVSSLFIEDYWGTDQGFTWPNIPYSLGIFKGDLAGASACNPPPNGSAGSPPFNGGWDPGHRWDYEVVFVVMRYNIDPGGHSTCDLWIKPPYSSFYTNEDNLPTPTVANVGGGVADVPGGVSLFYCKVTRYPVSRYIADLRIGTTWASVTPPAAPAFALANVALLPTDTTAVFASRNVGNPVDCGTGQGYHWQFTAPGGSPQDLIDGAGPSGTSTLSGSTTGTLTITGPAQGDVGTYTVIGSSISPAPSDNSATLTGSASATLTFLPPRLSVIYSAPNAVITWPTNWTGFTLEETTQLNSGVWITNLPPPYSVAGTNYSVPVNAASAAKFFRLIK